MRTNIEIDDELMAKAMKASGERTKRATVERGLQLLLELDQQRSVRRSRGALKWEGSLDDMRRDS
ncbi:MAG: type II toxin-antitoxin system VapB family antitoxin [Sphingomonadales bacterium]|nr:type II toxin-antitoxin system VapB family antitoxin [Sphingomonadales bacterium]